MICFWPTSLIVCVCGFGYDTYVSGPYLLGFENIQNAAAGKVHVAFFSNAGCVLNAAGGRTRSQTLCSVYSHLNGVGAGRPFI